VRHLYGLADRDATAPPVRGLDDAEVELVRGAASSALVSRHADFLPPTAARVLQHEAVVEAAMRQGTVLPARYGREDVDDAVLSHLVDEPQFAPARDLVRGCVELAVRVVAPAAPATPRPRQATSGRDYLQALRVAAAGSADERAAAARDADRVLSQLSERAKGCVVRRPEDGRTIAVAAVLLPEADQLRVRTLLAQLADEATSELICTGPWPPYSFVPDLSARNGVQP
jgi:hypothetical protein